MKIRAYAKSVGFEVIGKLTYMGMRKLRYRWYMDDVGNAYLIDIATGEIEIVQRRKAVKNYENG